MFDCIRSPFMQFRLSFLFFLELQSLGKTKTLKVFKMDNLKHIEMRNKIENMLNEGVLPNDISEKLGIRIGNQDDKGSIKWFLKCIRSRKHMVSIHKNYPHIFTRKRLNLDEERIKGLYLAKELPPYKIAKIMKCDTVTIFNRLRKMDVKIRNHSESHLLSNYTGIKEVKIVGLTPEKAYVLGVLCGDGWVTLSKSYRIGLSVKDKDFAMKFVESLKKSYGVKCAIYRRLRKNKNWNAQYTVSFSSKRACQDVSSYGTFNCVDWRVPKQILNSSDKQVIGYFLRGFYDSEGHVNASYYQLKATNTNWEGLKGIMALLTKFNVHFITTSKKHKNDKYKPCYEVLITGSDSYKLFKKYVGFSIKRKQKALLKLQNIRKQKRYTKNDFEKAIKLRKEGLHQAEISRRIGVVRSTIGKWFRNEDYHFSKLCR